MKKIVLTVVAALSLTMVNAETPKITESQMARAEKFDMSLNYDRLSDVLGLDYDQYAALKSIHSNYIKEMNNAAIAPAEDQHALVLKASTRELGQLRRVLDREQYRKYSMLLNVTLSNRGLLK